MSISPYQMAINNVSSFIRSVENKISVLPITAFQCSEVLAIAFCKNKEEVVNDIIFNEKKVINVQEDY